jgi:hypothetical protein
MTATNWIGLNWKMNWTMMAVMTMRTTTKTTSSKVFSAKMLTFSKKIS